MRDDIRFILGWLRTALLLAAIFAGLDAWDRIEDGRYVAAAFAAAAAVFLFSGYWQAGRRCAKYPEEAAQ